MFTDEEYKKMANALRFLSIDAVQNANSGHPGMPMGMADFIAVLYSEFLNCNPDNPNWYNRDRFILSNGHGSMLQYAVLHLMGYGITIDDIRNFRKLGSKTPGHPEYMHTPGVETTTGPLGQGLANAVGMAIASKKSSQDLGNNFINHKIYVTVGDGCLMEGISHEAASLAGHLCLNNLIVIFDDNEITIDGPTSLSSSEDITKRFQSYGFEVLYADGHDYASIRNALSESIKSEKPVIIRLKTQIGYGSPNKSNKSSSHGSPLGLEEISLTRKILDWNYEPFVIPDEIRDLWSKVKDKNLQYYQKWEYSNKIDEYFSRVKNLDIDLSKIAIRDELIPNSRLNQTNDFKSEDAQRTKEYVSTAESCKNRLDHLKMGFGIKSEATRKSSGRVVSYISQHFDFMIGGSADLTGSNDTKSDNMNPIEKNSFSGNYIYYGIREHAMGAIMNGISLYGAHIPYSGTFLVFSDYMRPAIRLSALMKQKVIYVMTHDSIGLGEDGPTHQPVEHLASLRAIPNLKVLRPWNLESTIKSWEIALKYDGPTVISLTRQNLRQENKYIYKIDAECDVIIYATGSEIEIASDAAAILNEKYNTKAYVYPILDLSEVSEPIDAKFIVCVEAAVKMGWEKLLPHGKSAFIGMDSFGASGEYKELYKSFGITAEDIVAAIYNTKFR